MKTARRRRSTAGYIYFVVGVSEFWGEPTPVCKIGASRDPHRRFKSLQGLVDFPIKLLAYVPTSGMYGNDRIILQHFKDRAIIGEFFRIEESEIGGFVRQEFPDAVWVNYQVDGTGLADQWWAGD